MDVTNLRREARYGMPAADQIMFNRHYIIGYSYYFRQAKWALELVDEADDTERMDNFRADYRVPELFRADLKVYVGSGFDRGHLVSSANQRDTEIQNSETFLLSNMSPQAPKFNRGIWKELESEIRRLNNKPSILETYCISGPVWFFDQPVEVIGGEDQITMPVPHAYFKSVLTENKRGHLHMWSFLLPNELSDQTLDTFQVDTLKLERITGVKFWQNLVGKKIDAEKSKVRKMWR